MDRHVFKSVELHWMKLDPNPVPDQFGFTGWEVTMKTKCKETAQDMKKKGLNVKQEGATYSAKVKQPQTTKTGKENNVPTLVDAKLKPIEDPSVVGNGSVGNVQTFSFNWEYAGKKGVSHRLQAIQVVKLNEYQKVNHAFSEEDGFDLEAQADEVKSAQKALDEELWG